MLLGYCSNSLQRLKYRSCHSLHITCLTLSRQILYFIHKFHIYKGDNANKPTFTALLIGRNLGSGQGCPTIGRHDAHLSNQFNAPSSKLILFTLTSSTRVKLADLEFAEP